jgi:hypothetical protein
MHDLLGAAQKAWEPLIRRCDVAREGASSDRNEDRADSVPQPGAEPGRRDSLLDAYIDL